MELPLPIFVMWYDGIVTPDDMLEQHNNQLNEFKKMIFNFTRFFGELWTYNPMKSPAWTDICCEAVIGPVKTALKFAAEIHDN